MAQIQETQQLKFCHPMCGKYSRIEPAQIKFEKTREVSGPSHKKTIVMGRTKPTQTDGVQKGCLCQPGC